IVDRCVAFLVLSTFFLDHYRLFTTMDSPPHSPNNIFNFPAVEEEFEEEPEEAPEEEPEEEEEEFEEDPDEGDEEEEEIVHPATPR
nr:hypothetical protein [Tanacetum cinerariifolium]